MNPYKSLGCIQFQKLFPVYILNIFPTGVIDHFFLALETLKSFWSKSVEQFFAMQ